MPDPTNRILDEISRRPGQKAGQIAAALGLERRDVNSALYGPLRNKVQQDSAYRWYPKGTPGIEKRVDQAPEALDTPLAKLSRYYLDCLSHDDLGGVSEFAESAYGDPKYVELTALPVFDEENGDPFESDGARQLLGRLRRDRNRQTIFLGYPVRLKRIRSTRSKWEGFKLEPVLLFPFAETDSQYVVPVLSDDLPQINFQALKSLSDAGESSLLEEAIQLAQELGLENAPGEQPEVDELLSRLREIRPDWDWLENLDPYELSHGEPLAALDEQGIYNRAVLICAERSPYTRGLESELRKLQSIEESTYSGTALGAWLAAQCIDSPAPPQDPLLEVLPLNSEQRQAVRQALSNPLTVITGPPGTGKSQVVTSILINAAWRGKTVLFASKNNKAVDVVEVRVNSLGPRPILLRLGANEYQSKLADYLTSLLAATATRDDQEKYQEYQRRHHHLQERSAAIDRQADDLLRLRNEVDALEQRVEQTRKELGEESFRRLRSLDPDETTRVVASLRGAIEQADKTKQSLVTRLGWQLLRESRFRHLSSVAHSCQAVSVHLGLKYPEGQVDSSTIAEWIRFNARLAARASEALEVSAYFSKLNALANTRSLEDLSRLRNELTEELSANSEALWETWLRLQPSRMTAQQRKILGDYCALLQMITSANDENRQLGRDVFRRYHELFPQITPTLSCWAVTSLSARGRLPFDANYFDLLVIDEASQCDIASALPLLFRARRVVVIGDPMQLRHISALSKQQDQQLLSKHGLVRDFPGWAYSPRSLFDLASSLCRSEDVVALRDHHRSHADIIEFSNMAFYEGRLRVATAYQRLRRVPDEPVVRWAHVQGKVVRPGTGGAVNETEARRVVAEVKRLIEQGYRGTVGVVSPFRAQANRIRDLIYGQDGVDSRISDLDLLADTVHKFQGDERDLMIFSPVVSSGITESALGFLRNNPNLFNVAVTRARAALVVVGDHLAAKSCGVEYLAQFASYVERLDGSDVRDQARPNADFGPGYPTVSQPELVSEWERLLYGAMYAAGIHSIPQYPVDKYLLDFAIILGDRRLNVEVDGERYHRNWDGELCRRDQIRNQRLLELGWDVMRFWVYQIRDDMDHCVWRVRQWMEASESNLDDLRPTTR